MEQVISLILTFLIYNTGKQQCLCLGRDSIGECMSTLRTVPHT